MSTLIVLFTTNILCTVFLLWHCINTFTLRNIHKYLHTLCLLLSKPYYTHWQFRSFWINTLTGTIAVGQNKQIPLSQVLCNLCALCTVMSPMNRSNKSVKTENSAVKFLLSIYEVY